MDDAVSILLFCHSLDSRLRLLLRLMKVMLKFGFLGHAAKNCLLVWFRDGSDGVILFPQFLLRVGCVERPETIVV
jgi:hypothetical protein